MNSAVQSAVLRDDLMEANSRMPSPNTVKSKRFLFVGARTTLFESLSIALQHLEGIQTELFASTQSLLERLDSDMPVDAIFIDVPNRTTTSLQQLSEIVQAAMSSPVAIICDEVDAGLLEASMDRGARGVVLTSMSLQSFTTALSMLSTGETYLPAGYIKMLRAKGGRSFGEFSEREIKILRELASGSTNKEISDRHSIAIATVKMHVHSVCKKLHVKSRLHAVAVARKRGIV